MPRASAAFRSCLSLVHRSVDGWRKTEAIRWASVRPIPRLYKRRASIIRRTSLSWATCTWGKRSSSASVLVRSRNVRSCRKPRASSAIMDGWITMCPWFRCFRNSWSRERRFPERKWSIQIEVSARINSSPACGEEYSSVSAWCLPGMLIGGRSPAR